MLKALRRSDLVAAWVVPTVCCFRGFVTLSESQSVWCGAMSCVDITLTDELCDFSFRKYKKETDRVK
jgi:hypothetical protein